MRTLWDSTGLKRLAELPAPVRSVIEGGFGAKKEGSGNFYTFADGSWCEVTVYQAEQRRRELAEAIAGVRAELTPNKGGRPAKVKQGDIAAALALVIDGGEPPETISELYRLVMECLENWHLKPREETVREVCSDAHKRLKGIRWR